MTTTNTSNTSNTICHLYLRASKTEQDSERALSMLTQFAADKNLTIAGVYADNFSGTKLDRPELNRLLATAEPGSIFLCESTDRLSRLSQEDWSTLKATIKSKGLRLVIADLPTSHQLASGADIGSQILDVINDMLIDLMATMARLDQQKRVERIEQGLARKKEKDPSWKPAGKQINKDMHATVRKLLADHPTMTADHVAKLAGVGVATVYRIKKLI
jgi:DNA invertase Pin-like site-specific DNA recombinase